MNKTKIYNFIDLCLWIINPFLIILVFFDQKIEAGLFLQWLGKMHPLALHFPIVFGILIGLYFLFFSRRRLSLDIEKLVVACNALFASVVALLGIFLAKHGAYEGEIFNLHKWGGIAIAFLSWLLLFVLKAHVILRNFLTIVFLVVLIGATHKGAQITHGINALSFPEKETIDIEEEDRVDSTATLFQVAVEPILNQKCVSCHGPDKVKGDLRLDSPEHILRGGESGDVLTAGSKGQPILLELLHLPVEDEFHMPPDGKLQLTENELNLLTSWIERENNFDIKLIELDSSDSLFILTENYIAANQTVEIITDLPDLEEYNTDYCNVEYLYYGTDKVAANFFQASFYKRETLKNLLKIKEMVVRLNMQNMPLEKEDLNMILQFQNLEKVNLNSTGLSMQEIGQLKSLANLQSLAICGINFNENELDNLLDNSGFSSINVWADNVNKNQLDKLIAKYPSVNFVIGDNLEDKVMQLNPPVIVQDSSIIKTSLHVEIKHLLNGVDVFFSTDGSDPDSLGQKYYEPVSVDQNTVLKTRAYKKGWLSSEVVQRTFYKSGIAPDTIYLSETPHPKYLGKGAKTLIDRSMGETNISNGEWLGYKDYDLEFTFGFNETKPLKSVEINSLTALGQHIFPLKSITVFASDDGRSFKPVVSNEFPEIDKGTPRQAELYKCALPENTRYKYYRVKVSNLKKMPEWHQAKGKPAWVFVDEIFLN